MWSQNEYVRERVCERYGGTVAAVVVQVTEERAEDGACDVREEERCSARVPPQTVLRAEEKVKYGAVDQCEFLLRTPFVETAMSAVCESSRSPGLVAPVEDRLQPDGGNTLGNARTCRHSSVVHRHTLIFLLAPVLALLASFHHQSEHEVLRLRRACSVDFRA